MSNITAFDQSTAWHHLTVKKSLYLTSLDSKISFDKSLSNDSKYEVNNSSVVEKAKGVKWIVNKT